MNYSQALYERAGEALASARFCLERGSLAAAVDRAYYATLYAARAALLTRGVSPKKHREVVRHFNRHFVEAGCIDASLARIIPQARDLCEVVNYELVRDLDAGRVATVIADVARFVEALEPLIAETSVPEKPPQRPALPATLPDHLAPTVRAALDDAAAVLRDRYGERLRHLVLYGSHARGEAHDESDVDVLVVLRDPFDTVRETRQLADIAWELLGRYGLTVHLLPFQEDRYLDQGHPLMMNVREEGILL